MTTAYLGYGAKVKFGDGASPEVFATLGNLKDFEDSESAELVETTNHSSTGSRKEYIAGLIDGDEITLPVNLDPNDATHDRTTGLRAKLRQVVNFRFEEPQNSVGLQVAAIVIGVSNSYPVADVMTCEITIKKTGSVSTYAVA